MNDSTISMTQISSPPEHADVDFLSRPLAATLNLDWEKTIYLLLILAAIVTRFWDLGSRVMSHDESLHTQFSYQFYNGDGFNHTPLMHGPLLFHVTAAFYWLLGDSDLSARVPVAILGVLLVAMPYLLRQKLGRVGALFTSFLFLISPFITYYSRYIRHDIYVIVWALIVVTASWYYIRHRQDKHLWWFAAALALMFATKEVAYIYVAIFGSFLVLRLGSHLVTEDWFAPILPRLRLPLAVTAVGLLMIGGGFAGQYSVTVSATLVEEEEATEGFAADPNQDLATEEEDPVSQSERVLRWVQLAGVGAFGLGLLLVMRVMRPHLDSHPEFDLILLFATLILPTTSPLLTTIAGWNPLDSTLSKCVLDGQDSMTSLQLLAGRLGNSVCWSAFLSSGVVRAGAFLILTLVIAVLVGLWWDKRRWLVAAVIFHTIFALLYTSMFTNPAGWSSGMIQSLGYWLEQQGVERGSQPWFYYLFVVPFYEFLPLIFAFAAARLWMKKQKLNKIWGYWLSLILISTLAFSLANWLFNRAAVQSVVETSSLPGVMVALLVMGAGFLYWFFARRRQLLREYGLEKNLLSLVNREALFDFVPFLIWWLLLTFVIYSYAGEKMPWLSTHFVIPMALLSGWYFNEILKGIDFRTLLSKVSLQFVGLTTVLLIAIMLAAGPLFLGLIRFGNQDLQNLDGIGRFLGNVVSAGIVLYLWRLGLRRVHETARRPLITLGFFALLSLLTIRFAFMASFPNADSSSEFLVYAHGAPATKNIVMEQVEGLSMRLHGDKSIKVAFSRDTSWPFTWYLRDYPNRVFYGDNPSHTLTESPIIITGNLDWATTEPYLGNDYEQHTYTYLWWPMEEYRKFSWNALFGDPNAAEPRGIGNPRVRQALWDIFFYRDYENYGELFGGTYEPGAWPLRHEMRLYVRRDVLANLWDFGIGAVNAQGIQDPYAEKELQVAPVLVLNESGIGGAEPGQMLAPRNVAVAADGRIFVADSGNHRIQAFDASGAFLYQWGGSGTEPGQFNEPWGIAVDDESLFVADTWNHRLQKFTLDGEFVAVFGRSGSPAEGIENDLGLYFGPRDIAILDDDLLLTTDTGNHRMQLLTKDGVFLDQVGAFGNLLGQLNEPVGLGIGPDGTFFLADTWNSRIQQFSPDLFAFKEWTVSAWEGQSTNNKPYLAADSGGRIYVTDPEGYRILIFDSFGEYLGRFGSFGQGSGDFGLPNGISVDADDNIYVADAGNNRVLKFAPIFGAPLQPLPPDPAGEDGEIDGESSEQEPLDPSEELPETAPDQGESGDDDKPAPSELNDGG